MDFGSKLVIFDCWWVVVFDLLFCVDVFVSRVGLGVCIA